MIISPKTNFDENRMLQAALMIIFPFDLYVVYPVDSHIDYVYFR